MQLSTCTLIPGQGEGGNPLARRAAGETTPAPRLLLFSSCSGHHAVGSPRVSAGVLAPSQAASPILSPLDHPLVGSSSWVSRPSTNARRFPKASHLAPNLRRRGRPRAPCPPCAQPRTKQPVARNPPPNPVEVSTLGRSERTLGARAVQPFRA